MHAEAQDLENRETFGGEFRKHFIQTIPEDNPLKKCFARMSENERQMLVRSFEVAYYIGKKGRPYSDFPDLIELVAKLQHLPGFMTGLGHFFPVV